MTELINQTSNQSSYETLLDVAKEVTSIVQESSLAELLHGLMNPMTDSMMSYGITATAITIATIAIEWSLQQSNNKKRSIKKASNTTVKHTVKQQAFILKGRAGQTIGRVKMNNEQTIDSFISDLESLNQINRGRHSGPTVRFEIRGFQKPLTRLAGNFTHYSPFVGSLLFGQDAHEVNGIAKIQKRGKMIYSEVEFSSDLGHFRLELPHIPHAIGGKDLRFMVDIGCHTKNLVG
jgi:hypothetical protein